MKIVSNARSRGAMLAAFIAAAVVVQAAGPAFAQATAPAGAPSPPAGAQVPAPAPAPGAAPATAPSPAPVGAAVQPAAGAQNPAAAPNAGEYRLALGDTVRITVFQSPDLSLETRITESGTISYPLLGTVAIVGMSVPQAEKRIADGLRDGNFVKQPQVSINVVQVRGNLVSVLGQVGKPGRYPLEAGDVRLSDVIAAAGGILPAGHDIVVVTGRRKGEAFRKEVDMTSVFSQGNAGVDVLLQNGDVVWVERAPQIYVYGEVQRPGSLRLERGMTLMQVLAASGGLTAKGTTRRMQVHRKDAGGKTQVMEPTMTDVLQADDVVYVRESIL